MPGVQISELPIISNPDGTEVIPLETTGGVTGQISVARLAVAIAPFLPTQLLDLGVPAGLNSNIATQVQVDSTSILKLTSTANGAYSVDGIAAPNAARFLFVVNANTVIGGTLTLVDATGSASLAPNRILTQAGAGLTLNYNSGILLWYDVEQARWRVMG